MMGTREVTIRERIMMIRMLYSFFKEEIEDHGCG
jgi:hypothetical protein